MRVFVTGAAGFIGQAVTKELISHGHEVIGLARNDANVEILTKAGAKSHSGDLEDLESLKSGAKAADGVIHLGFVLDFNDLARSNRIDREAIEAMGEAISGTGKPLVIASGTLLTPKGKLATEDTEPERSDNPMSHRAFASDAVMRLSKENNVRGSVIRLAPTVHGEGEKGFVPMLANMARKNGFVTSVGDGASRWPAVHRLDAAGLFRLVLEKGIAGSTYNAAAEEGVPTKDIMTAIGERIQLPVENKPVDEAMNSIGVFAHIISMDNPTSSDKTRKELNWNPTNPGLIDDIKQNYFK